MDLLKSLCVFVTSVVHICPHIHMDLLREMQMYIIQICHYIHVILSKAAHEYKYVSSLINLE